ncbi:metallophosphoesterase [Asaia astilbis]
MRLIIPGVLLSIPVLNWLWPLPLPMTVRLVVGVFFVIAAFYHQWCRLSSGSVLAPEMPRIIVILFNWAFGALLFLTVLQLATDLVSLVIAAINWQPPRINPAMRVTVGAIAALLSAIGVHNALRVPPVRDVHVELPGLGKGFDGYTILQLSDLHLTTLFPAKWAAAVVARANATKADLIVISGDFIDGTVAKRRADVAPLAELRAKDGIFAVPGNHEYIFDYGAWIEHLQSLGMEMLLNRHHVIARGSERIVLAGVTDRAASSHGEAPPDLTLALKGRPDSAPVILLDHQPSGAGEAAKQGVLLQLSGHTHGGMILGLDRLVARGNAGFVSGRYRLGAMTLYVSNGTGLWPGFALRLGKGSEMTRFHLRAVS